MTQSQKPASLSVAQSVAYEQLTETIGIAPLVVLEGEPGCGKSTLIRRLLDERRGVRIGIRDLLSASANAAHPGLESHLMRLLEKAMERADLVVVDDFDRLLQGLAGVRGAWWQGGMQSLIDRASEQGQCLVFTGTNFRDEFAPELFGVGVFEQRMMEIVVPGFSAEDFAFYLTLELGAEVVQRLPIQRIFDHAPGLNGHQLQMLAALLRKHGRTDEAFIREMIDTRILLTNANLGEIADIRFSDLQGFEQIVDDLTTYVINPLKSDPRFDAIGLAPKRGVLLFGPPGTGKTSIGRALAHQMQGKFFMIDGTIPTEPANAFYPSIQAIFEAAKRAAPCVLFIDDADVLFQSDRSAGLSRYLLTMLDGLESHTAGKIAVIMTAMNPNHMPPALLRSGRVELWLETRPPPDTVRAAIIAADVAGLPASFQAYDFARISEVTEGFNAADMRRIVSDVKALYARDVVENRTPRGVDDYFFEAADGVRINKRLLQLAEKRELKMGVESGA